MTRPIIEVDALSKRYTLGQVRTGAGFIVQDLPRRAAAAARRIIRRRPIEQVGRRRVLWALRDVSFSVDRGEVVGIVGHNGAGKSTLLKLLSRITEPTSGRAVLRGRMQSLIEVGTGFHGELTGRENIFLKGAIHGMSTAEVKRSYDAIVDFAEVEDFLDTPLKRYSSGMRVRLGFAVAAFLRHDILVVDEVLVVGDARFRQRAMDRIKEAVRGEGTTVLFVSHDMSQIRDLCPRCLLLEEGRLIQDGETDAVLRTYLEPLSQGAAAAVVELGPPDARHLRRVALLNAAAEPTTRVRTGDGLLVDLDLEGLAGLVDLDPYVEVHTFSGVRLFRFRASMVDRDLTVSHDRRVRLRCRLDALPLVPGRYTLGVGLKRGRSRQERFERLIPFDVVEADVYGTGGRFLPKDGHIWVRGDWQALPDDGAGPAALTDPPAPASTDTTGS